ncbi:hypothetical protein EV121DRAFT_262329 [Schizophyllum commune]
MQGLLLLPFLLLIPHCAAVWPFTHERFTKNSLIDAGTRGLSGDERVIAFGDFNGDQLLDVLAIEDDQQTLKVYLWNHEQFMFQPSTTFHHPSKVYNVVPGDFTHNGKLDLLVMSEGSTSYIMDMLVYPALPQGGFDTGHPITVPPSGMVQPIPIDINGDMRIDLLGVTPSVSNMFAVWNNTWDEEKNTDYMFDVIDPPFTGNQCLLSNPHSNAVIDLNGDCLADLFLVCDKPHGYKSYQIWINNKDAGFSLADEGWLPSGVQSISFADVDRDGTIDMIFPTCEKVTDNGFGSNCYINIAYNQQLPLCASSSPSAKQRNCRTPDELCTADPNFKFDLTAESKTFVRFPFTDLFSTRALVVKDATYDPAVPLSLKMGDFNLDGFPDMLLIAAESMTLTPFLIQSVPCDKGVAGCEKDGSGRRGWQVVKKDVDDLKAVKDARSVSFVDMDEDGTLDIMVQRSGRSGAGKVLFIQNNFYYDAFFMKAIVLNGACDNGWCYTSNGTRYHPFGVSYSGATYKYTVLDTSGRRSAAQFGQLPQTSYHSLQTPYSFFGLGRTNNYIENLFVGATIHAPEHFINMEGVVPNSKVVIHPSAREGEAWRRELYLRPGKWIPWVTLTVIIGTVVMAVIVLVLHLNEKREDEMERRRISHRINFDAL